MSAAPLPDENADTVCWESDAERQGRLAWEAKGIAEADAELEAGLFVDAADMRIWIESIGTDHEMSPPPTRHR